MLFPLVQGRWQGSPTFCNIQDHLLTPRGCPRLSYSGKPPASAALMTAISVAQRLWDSMPHILTALHVLTLLILPQLPEAGTMIVPICGTETSDQND